MRQYHNERLIKRNAALSKMLLYAGLGLLIVAFILSITQRENIVQPIVLALVGMLLSQVGMPIYNQWGRTPRMDEILDAAFKGLDNRYALFHYVLGTRHALVTPAGVYALLPRAEAGEITYSEGKWWKEEQRSGLLRRSGKRAIRNIDREAAREIGNLNSALGKVFPQNKDIDISVILIFLNVNADVKIDAAPWTAVHIKKVKAEVRKLQKQRSLDASEIDRVIDRFGL